MQEGQKIQVDRLISATSTSFTQRTMTDEVKASKNI